MAALCNISKNTPSKINFLATVRIPVGYKLVAPPEYGVYLTLDSTNLKTNALPELVESVLTIEKDADGHPTRTLACSSKVVRVSLHGSIYYNVVISKFRTEQSLDVGELTAFSANDVVPIDVTLGFGCIECPYPADTLYGFKVEITQLDEFVITHSGSQVFHNAQDPNEFYAALANSSDTEVLQIPYTITITPVVPEQS